METLRVVRKVALAWYVAILWIGCSGAQAEPCDQCDRNTITAHDIPKAAPRFSDFAAVILPIKHPAKPKLDGRNPRSRLFRTMIWEGAVLGPNFAGHYTLVSYGCGASCSAFVIVEAVTGRVFQLADLATVQGFNIDPTLWDKSTGWIRFKKNSRLIRVIGDINEDPALRGVSFFVWNGRQLVRILFNPHPTKTQ